MDPQSPVVAQPAISPDRALQVAHFDALRAYKDLAPYSIRVVLEEDGWHVDYELKDPRLNGGGPHYVINAVSGQIIWKKYEQ